MTGSLLVCGTSSDAGKSVIVAGLCRFLRDAGIKVAPFKAQNMSLNSAVTADGAEIGRAQAAQAFAAGIEPEAEMNPILLKPGSDTHAQVIVGGRPLATSDAVGYGDLIPDLMPTVVDAFESLRSRFDVVVCEGAGSLAEFNLRNRDLVNLGFAHVTESPVVVVADIDRGGSFAGLYGSLALLEADDQRLVQGFLLNRFRGDARLLDDALARFTHATGRPFYGVLPWIPAIGIDAEDALAVASSEADGDANDPLSVVVVRLGAMSNFTDLDPLALDPHIAVRFTASPAEIERADIVVLPGSKTTVADLVRLRERGLDRVLTARAKKGRPIVGICGGFQMLGTEIVDDVESGAGRVPGLGLLPVVTEFAHDKVLARRAGRWIHGGADVEGYEIRHGTPRVLDGEPMFSTDQGDEGCVVGAVYGTSWHGIFEADDFRTRFVTALARSSALDWEPAPYSFAGAREDQARRLGALIADHCDTDGLLRLIEAGPDTGVPTLPPAGIP
ncbi:MAG: cobyric acid synthase [Actinomycetota bacterium]